MPRLALLQSRAYDDPRLAWEAHADLMRCAAADGAQILVTQELFLTPYFCDRQDPERFQLAEMLPGPTTDQLAALAAELQVVIVSSHFEKRGPGLFHNTAVVHDADGTQLGLYRKSHIPQDPGFEEKFYFTPGDSGWPVWQTRYGPLGVLVCWDQWYPEAARLMALGGARLILYPTAIGWLAEEKTQLGEAQHHAWEAIQCGHAVANGCFVAAVNRVGTEQDTEFWGQSFVANPYGQVVTRASADQEEILYHDLDWSEVDAFREIWPFFRDRRIDAYAGLLERWRSPHV